MSQDTSKQIAMSKAEDFIRGVFGISGRRSGVRAGGKSSASKRMDFRFDGGAGGCADFAKIVFVLESDPEFGAGAKITAETKGSVWSDRTVPTDDGCDTAMGNIQIDGEAVLGDAQWLKELGANDFSGVWKIEFWCGGFHFLIGLI